MNELSCLRIVIVEDDEDSRFLLTSFLSICGAEVKACESALEALREIPRSNPDVIISDIMMPERDGYWLMKQVRQLKPEQGRDVPAIALTARTGEKARARALESGFQLHVPKPAILEELIAAIKIVTVNPKSRNGYTVLSGQA
jgi:CheY-like chemotaxis protein